MVTIPNIVYWIVYKPKQLCMIITKHHDHHLTNVLSPLLSCRRRASQQGLESTQDEGLKLVEEQQPIEILIALLMWPGECAPSTYRLGLFVCKYVQILYVYIYIHLYLMIYIYIYIYIFWKKLFVNQGILGYLPQFYPIPNHHSSDVTVRLS